VIFSALPPAFLMCATTAAALLFSAAVMNEYLGCAELPTRGALARPMLRYRAGYQRRLARRIRSIASSEWFGVAASDRLPSVPTNIAMRGDETLQVLVLRAMAGVRRKDQPAVLPPSTVKI